MGSNIARERTEIMFARWIVICAFAALQFAAPVRADETPARSVEVWKSPTCGCCRGWVAHMKNSGFKVATNNVEYDILYKIKRQAGIGEEMASCHTAKVGGYVIEGHVPAEDVARLLKEKPDAVGLAVPGMPVGSPGMEYGNEKEPYEVLLVKKDGSTEVFARHGQ
jgi:hypothetical protein